MSDADSSRTKVPLTKDPSDYRWAGLLWMTGGIGFLLVVSTLEALYPGYSVHGNAISDLLAVGAPTFLDGEPLMFAVATAWVLGAYLLFRDLGQTKMLVLNALPGLGLMLAVVSPENVNLDIHSLGAIMALFGGPFAAMLSYRRITTDLRYVAFLLGAISLGCAFIEFGSYGSPFFEHTLGTGGWERTILYPLVLWFIAYGSYLMAAPRTSLSGTEVQVARFEPLGA